ncbi:cytochrome c oxidase assembly protein subunit 11 [Amaricoccus macauensis]|uniref:Cytochrome c oxidase assembly protein CtaG n=1 Tax=Amaricoccus macauensis TaxID=57001 RepID=A0A840ST38_9RHOB|nr:cytochrome c oxidase assembly protein [Amaricoccus macauensis]MBB5223920.1 cytochrome c oxidase assembly protein subunit 11 [Amaricoccus macauensis]
MAGNKNTRVALWLVAFVGLMVGASFAAVPFYTWFCKVTGYAGTTGRAEALPADEVLDRMVTVHFDANLAPGMPWEFRPKQRSVEIRLGETGLAFFEAHNPTNEPVAGQAGFNVVPFSTGEYFDKIACFCFELQVLQPGESIDMPVTFYVDPAMLNDRETRDVTNITLSYTMYRADLPDAAPVGPRTDAGVEGPTRLAAGLTDRRQTIEQ